MVAPSAREKAKHFACGYLKALDTKPIQRFALTLHTKDPQHTIYTARNGNLNIQGLLVSTFWRQFCFKKVNFGVLVRTIEVPDIVASAKGACTAGAEALCMCLGCFAYPNRLCDLQEYFGWHYWVISSITNKVMFCLAWLNVAQLKDMSEVNWASPFSFCVYRSLDVNSLTTSGFTWCKR